uniref:PLOD1-3-like GT domain-containing protein n=1 Tax=viral metagenome TaxID=1070528 RepID=A0A6C0J8K0_9ZZZZ
MSNIIFVTFATHKERLFNNLIKSCKKNKVKLNIIGFKKKWKGWKNRAKYILKYLDKFRDNQIICCLDAFDSLVLSNDKELYNKFIKYYKNYNIVFSNDNSNNILIKSFKNKKFSMCKNNFLSAGLFMGYNNSIKNILIDFINSRYEDDQKYFTKLCNNDDKIVIDLDNRLFYNIQFFESEYTITNKNRVLINNNIPVIISAPGNVNIEKLVNKLGYTYNEHNNLKYILDYLPGVLYLYKYEISIIIICIYIKFYSGID